MSLSNKNSAKTFYFASIVVFVGDTREDFQIIVQGMDDKYSFPILKDNEIMNVMKQLNIPLEIEEINNPKPAKIVEVLIQFMSVCSGIPSDEITSFDRETAKKYSLDGYNTILVAINAFEPLYLIII